MKTTRLLQTWLDDALDGDVVADPREINREANANLRYFQVPRRSAIPDVESVEAFVQSVVAARRDQLRERRSRSMTMYWWHDELAGQLRCSIVCTSHRRLPFGARIEHLPSVRPIVEEWLASPWLKGIRFDQLTCDSSTEPEDEEVSQDYRVNVWSTVLRNPK